MISTKRIHNKYKKYRRSCNIIVALYKIIIFTLNDFGNFILSFFLRPSKDKIDLVKNQKVLFIEPYKQGFGDLLFQTTFAEIFSKQQLSFLIRKEHKSIIQNNPFIEYIYNWNLRDISKILSTKYDIIILLGKSTMRESLLGLLFFNSKKIIPDFNLRLWHSTFHTNNSTTAWQLLINSSLKNQNTIYKPQLFIHTKSQSKVNYLTIVAATKDKNKSIVSLENLILDLSECLLNSGSKIYLIGQGEYNFNFSLMPSNIINFTNKISYYETMDLISTSLCTIGPEGSLIHVATTLNIPTIIFEDNRDFNRHSIFDRENIYKFQSYDKFKKEVQEIIVKYLK